MKNLYWFHHEGEYVTVVARSLKRAKRRVAHALGVPRKRLRIAADMME